MEANLQTGDSGELLAIASVGHCAFATYDITIQYTQALVSNYASGCTRYNLRVDPLRPLPPILLSNQA